MSCSKRNIINIVPYKDNISEMIYYFVDYLLYTLKDSIQKIKRGMWMIYYDL